MFPAMGQEQKSAKTVDSYLGADKQQILLENVACHIFDCIH